MCFSAGECLEGGVEEEEEVFELVNVSAVERKTL